jgi:serine/threonine protein kinase
MNALATNAARRVSDARARLGDCTPCTRVLKVSVDPPTESNPDVSAEKICPTCSAEYPPNERFCPKDGTVLRSKGGSATDLVGSVIAERYHVLRKLGEGGMGQVYLAEHVKMKRQSAVKVMNPAMVHDADAIGRFNREAANASRIDHPNVAAIYDFGETPEGLVYLAMQYIEGETLTGIVTAAGALPPLRAADIVRQAAEGLHAAHGLGIVHRDLKPDNIMISKDRDGLDCVKVVDFGIAKAADGESQKVTRTGTVVGTPDYMSPEQLAGEKLDGRTDQYSLAIVAFNLLTGELPFPGATTQTSMIMRLTEKPKSLLEMNAGVSWPVAVQAVMDRALERDASLRFPSTRDFGRALYAAIEKMPLRPSSTRGTLVVDAQPRGAGPTTKEIAEPAQEARKKNRRRILVISAIGVLMAVLAGVMLTRGESVAAFDQGVAAHREGRREAAIGAFMQATKEAPSDPMPHVYLSRMAREANDLVTANTEARIAVQLGPDNGPALRELASTLFAQQSYAGARAFYTRAVKADDKDRLSQGFLGCSLIRLGRVDEGMRWIERAGSGAWSSCAPAPGSVPSATQPLPKAPAG